MPNDADYILGHTDVERRRLRDQATFMEQLTTRFLLDAGLRPGMRVLDVGSGFGDVSLLAASLVRPGGCVVGIERDADAVTQATRRADQLGVDDVSFVAGDLREVAVEGQFDAVIGRFVLMYIADPVVALTAVARHVRPGGVVAFQEWHPDDSFLAEPPVELWTATGDVLVETFRAAGTNVRLGLGLRAAYLDAGLPAPELRVERLAGGGSDYLGYSFLAGLIRSIVPMIEHYGVSTADQVDVATLEDRLRADVVAADATVAFPAIVSAWARRASDSH